MTQQHIFNPTDRNQCHLCDSNAVLNIEHILLNCSFIKEAQQNIFGKICILELLKNINIQNVNNIITLLKHCNIYNLI